MVDLFEPEDGMTIYNSVCGTGSLLVECNSYLKARDETGVFKLYAEELNRNSWRLCKLAMAISGHFDSSIKQHRLSCRNTLEKATSMR
jgi:type I restriction-modification system DNA methylase subunit